MIVEGVLIGSILLNIGLTVFLFVRKPKEQHPDLERFVGDLYGRGVGMLEVRRVDESNVFLWGEK